jgi:hypothetical protein
VAAITFCLVITDENNNNKPNKMEKVRVRVFRTLKYTFFVFPPELRPKKTDRLVDFIAPLLLKNICDFFNKPGALENK